jgi:Zn-dependent M32 family carboxypeptidase
MLIKKSKSNSSLVFNKEENTLSLSEENLNQAYKDNEESIEHILSEYGLDKRTQRINKVFSEFLYELDSLFKKIN